MYKSRPNDCDWCGWFNTVCSLRGRSVRHTVPPLLLVTIVAVLRTLALESRVFGGAVHWPVEYRLFSGAVRDGYPLLMVSLSFLLVYRLNRSAVRYWDARSAAGKLIEISRVLAGEAVVYCSHDAAARDELCRWTVAFPVATRNFLRSLRTAECYPDELLSIRDPYEELQGVLSTHEAAALQTAEVQPLLCLHRMRVAAFRACSSSRGSREIAASTLRSMEDHISILTGTMGAMERINNTPLPFAYVAHLRTFLVVYLLGLPFMFSEEWGWSSVAVVVVIAFSLLGIEASAVSCERPFGLGPNHLPLDTFCEVVASNVLQILRQASNPELVHNDWMFVEQI